jgi:muconolactone delta-isomerase
VGRINRGDGDGGDPARSPSGQASFPWPNRSNWRASREFAEAGTPAFLNHLLGIPYRSTDGHWGLVSLAEKTAAMLFLVISNPRSERPAEVAKSRQSFWPWISKFQTDGACKHIYARVRRWAIAVFDVESNEVLHRILNEWADIIPVQFDVYPLIDMEATNKMLAAQVAASE